MSQRPPGLPEGPRRLAARQPARRPGGLREFLTDIRSEVNRLADLTVNLLTLSRLEHGEISLDEEFDLLEAAGEGVKRLRPLAQAEGVEGEHLLLRGHRGFMLEVVTNLVHNAIKHSPRGGRVEVLVGREKRAALLRVTDEGPGIPTEDRDRIFERFVRLDEARARATGGSGLGLSIVKEIVSLHGGSIRVGEAPGGGAEFSVLLPVRETVSLQPRKRSEKGPH